jgi:hypothetical protein
MFHSDLLGNSGRCSQPQHDVLLRTSARPVVEGSTKPPFTIRNACCISCCLQPTADKPKKMKDFVEPYREVGRHVLVHAASRLFVKLLSNGPCQNGTMFDSNVWAQHGAHRNEPAIHTLHAMHPSCLLLRLLGKHCQLSAPLTADMLCRAALLTGGIPQPEDAAAGAPQGHL